MFLYLFISFRNTIWLLLLTFQLQRNHQAMLRVLPQQAGKPYLIWREIFLILGGKMLVPKVTARRDEILALRALICPFLS